MPSLPNADQAITKDQLTAMAARFNQYPGGSYGHTGEDLTVNVVFPIAGVLELLVANGYCTDNDTIATVKAKTGMVIRAYFAQHVTEADCPPEIPVPAAGQHDYIGRNTVVLVLSEIEGDEYVDLIGNEESLLTDGFPPMRGLDRTHVCPPQCGPKDGNSLS